MTTIAPEKPADPMPIVIPLGGILDRPLTPFEAACVAAAGAAAIDDMGRGFGPVKVTLSHDKGDGLEVTVTRDPVTGIFDRHNPTYTVSR